MTTEWWPFRSGASMMLVDMKRTFHYWTGGPTEEDVRRGLRATADELGHEPSDVIIKPSAPPHATGGFEVSFSLDLPARDLLDRIERTIREAPPSVPVSLAWTGVFGDLFWEPISRRDFWINEIVILESPRRYGVIGHFSGEYRVFVGSNADQPYERGFLAAEHDLNVAVARVLRFVEHGPEVEDDRPEV